MLPGLVWIMWFVPFWGMAPPYGRRECKRSDAEEEGE